MSLLDLLAVALIGQTKSSKTVSTCAGLSVVVFAVGADCLADSVGVEEETL